MIYICYYAVRDEEGNYQGTLEVTQDVTETRVLEGERRLLTYGRPEQTMDITPQSKLLDILEAHPALEAEIVTIAPPFQNLKNPVLRRTVGKLATLERVAQVGGIDAVELVNTLRRAVGQARIRAKMWSALS